MRRTPIHIKRTLSVKREFELEASCVRASDNKPVLCGTLFAEYYEPEEGQPDSGPFWNVANVEVEPEFRRQGVATALYEAAAKEACRRDAVSIGSTYRPTGAASNQFWAKQFAKGRAVRYTHVRRYGEYGAAPVDRPPFVLRHCGITALDGARLRFKRRR